MIIKNVISLDLEVKQVSIEKLRVAPSKFDLIILLDMKLYFFKTEKFYMAKTYYVIDLLISALKVLKNL
jgi:hypothetical protein